jgi:hypothetical protein
MESWGKIPKIDGVIFEEAQRPEYPLPGKIVGCLMCEKPFLMRPYFGFPDQVCPDCFNTYLDCAKIVCQKCDVVIAKVQPDVLDSGFHIRSRSVLHSNKCNVCSPGLKKSLIVEIDRWERRMGRKTIITP